MGHERMVAIERKSRWERKCSNKYPMPDSGHVEVIHRGDRYVNVRIPPGHDVLENDYWHQRDLCMGCGGQYVKKEPECDGVTTATGR